MKHISDLIDLNNFKDKTKASDSSIGEETANIVNMLFRDLKGIFPAFRQAWPTDEEFNCAKRNWIKAFIDEKINSIEQLSYGLKRCRKEGGEYAPSVGKFMRWCEKPPEDSGFPPLRTAYDISILMNCQFSTHKHSSENVNTVIRNIIKQIGACEYRSMTSKDSMATFSYYYPIACKQFDEGALRDAPRAIPERTRKNPEDRERAYASREVEMNKIRTILSIPSPMVMGDSH